MRKLWTVLAALTCLGAQAATPELPSHKIQTFHTDNGVPVLFVRAKQLPMLDVAVVFHAGSLFDGKSRGRANMVSDLLAEGTTRYSAEQLALRFDDIGAEFIAIADRDKATVSLRTLTKKRYLNTAISTLNNVLTKANFPAAAVAREKKSILHAIEMQQQSPSTLASNALYSGLYGDTGYGVPVIGTTAGVSELTRDELLAFYHRYYVSKNAVIAMIGDVTLAQAKRVANKLTQGMREGVKAIEPHYYRANKRKGIHHILYPSSQMQIRMGEIAINRLSKDYVPMFVATHILGGSGGDSILYQSIREKHGLSYAPYSYVNPLWRNGPFVVSLQTRTSKGEQAVELTKKEIAHFIKVGPTKAQLAQAVEHLTGSIPLSVATNVTMLRRLVLIGFYHLPLDYTQQILHKLALLTPEKVQKVFAKHVSLNSMYIVTVGKKERA